MLVTGWRWGPETEWERQQRERQEREQALIKSGLLPPIPHDDLPHVISPKQASGLAENEWHDTSVHQVYLTPAHLKALKGGSAIIAIVGADSEYSYPYIAFIRPSGV